MKEEITFLSRLIDSVLHFLCKPLLFSCLLLSSLFSGNLFAAIWELKDSTLPYIARIQADPHFGSAVIFNPGICEQIGVACEFFKNHAYAHSVYRDPLVPPKAYASGQEDTADCWAAKNSRPREVRAAVELLLDDNRNTILNIPGDLTTRAKKVRACAEKSGNWIEDH